jgi:hypothetical protein
MTEPDEVGGRWFASASADALDGALRQAHEERFTGRLAALGTAGAEIHLADGLVTAIVTPAAPGPDSLLLKSGRVSEADWSRAVDSTGARGRLEETVVSGSLVGQGELDVIRTAALFDAMFALCLDAPEEWQARAPEPETEPALALLPGVAPAILQAEAARRHAQLTRRWGPPALLARARPVATAKAARDASGVILRHREIVLCANGRRTSRDIAFILGRGVYAVMIDIGLAERRGLLQTKGQPSSDTALPSVAPRGPVPEVARSVAGRAAQSPQQLPRRASRSSPQAEGMTPFPNHRFPAGGR